MDTNMFFWTEMMVLAVLVCIKPIENKSVPYQLLDDLEVSNSPRPNFETEETSVVQTSSEFYPTDANDLRNEVVTVTQHQYTDDFIDETSSINIAVSPELTTEISKAMIKNQTVNNANFHETFTTESLVDSLETDLILSQSIHPELLTPSIPDLKFHETESSSSSENKDKVFSFSNGPTTMLYNDYSSREESKSSSSSSSGYSENDGKATERNQYGQQSNSNISSKDHDDINSSSEDSTDWVHKNNSNMSKTELSDKLEIDEETFYSIGLYDHHDAISHEKLTTESPVDSLGTDLILSKSIHTELLTPSIPDLKSLFTSTQSKSMSPDFSRQYFDIDLDIDKSGVTDDQEISFTNIKENSSNSDLSNSKGSSNDSSSKESLSYKIMQTVRAKLHETESSSSSGSKDEIISYSDGPTTILHNDYSSKEESKSSSSSSSGSSEYDGKEQSNNSSKEDSSSEESTDWEPRKNQSKIFETETSSKLETDEGSSDSSGFYDDHDESLGKGGDYMNDDEYSGNYQTLSEKNTDVKSNSSIVNNVNKLNTSQSSANKATDIYIDEDKNFNLPTSVDKHKLEENSSSKHKIKQNSSSSKHKSHTSSDQHAKEDTSWFHLSGSGMNDEERSGNEYGYGEDDEERSGNGYGEDDDERSGNGYGEYYKESSGSGIGMM